MILKYFNSNINAPLIVYLDSLLFMSELFGFVNSRHFCQEQRRAIQISASFFWIKDFTYSFHHFVLFRTDCRGWITFRFGSPYLHFCGYLFLNISIKIMRSSLKTQVSHFKSFTVQFYVMLFSVQTICILFSSWAVTSVKEYCIN